MERLYEPVDRRDHALTNVILIEDLAQAARSRASTVSAIACFFCLNLLDAHRDMRNARRSG
jgi:hypothetical protein